MTKASDVPARLLSVAAMRAADAAAIAAGTPGIELMERAGAAVAAVAGGMTPGGAPVLVLCGPGANGGDGFVAARLLRDAGVEVKVGLLGDQMRLAGDAKLACERWADPITDASSLDFGGGGLIVDALFGAGLSRDLQGAAKALIERIRASKIPVLAVDLPSGVDGDTGAIRGAAVMAARTVTFVRAKPGHWLQPGRAHCGAITVADIGIGDEIVEKAAPAFFANEPALWRAALPALDVDAHKFRRGHLLVVAGGIEGVGAPRLSARAGLRSGAGLVTIAIPDEALSAHAALGPDALILRRCDGGDGLRALLSDRRLTGVVIGPALGLDRAARRKLDAALASDAACILDADALTLLAEDRAALRRAATRKPVVLTPHEGEFARLSGDAPELDETGRTRSKIERALAAARATGAVVILKGPDTVIASPDGRAAINGNAPPWLATAGSGDVLAGIAGALVAQSMPAFEAACAAVWLHGEAGARAGRGLIADDLPDQAGRALARLLDGRHESE